MEESNVAEELNVTGWDEFKDSPECRDSLEESIISVGEFKSSVEEPVEWKVSMEFRDSVELRDSEE